MKLTRKDFLLLFSIALLFLLSRLTGILHLPIFTDEAIYLRWSQIALHDASFRFISLTDGKQPLLIWLTAVALRFINNPLLAGRLISVLAGFWGMLGCFFLGREIFRKKTIGFISAVFYLVSPFTLWYDRLAVMDSLVACFYIWSIYLSVLLVRYLRLDIALILGFNIGLGLLTKTSSFFAIYLSPLMLILFDWKKKWRGLFKLLGLFLVSVLVSLAMYNVLRLSPWFYIISQKDHSFIYSFSEIIREPFKYFWGNLRSMIAWWFNYLTLPFFLLLLFSLFVRFSQNLREKLVLIGYWLIPFFALAAFGKVIYPRFILFMTVSLFPLLALGLSDLLTKFKVKTVRIFIVLLLFSYPFYFDSQIILNPVNAPLSRAERFQYLDDWPSGYGVSEVVAFLKVEKEKQPIFVATEGTFGLFPYALELEFYSDPDIKIRGYWPLPSQEYVLGESAGRPSYLLLKESQNLPLGWKAELVAQFQRGRGDNFLKFYKITP